jgi:hypothetical protein
MKILRIHNSGKEINLIKKIYIQKVDDKPRGFWYGVNGGWLKWCKDNMPEWEKEYNYELIFDQNIKILQLDTVQKMVLFEQKYQEHKNKLNFGSINWEKVANEFDGVEIAPYQWKLRFAMAWYYSWDCASGCIWNLNKIKLKKYVL